ncbi:MAG: glycosyltransferase family 9 protein [Planctomycetota bacterium]
MNIVCLGQQAWHVNWTAKQQLLTRLARRGHRVLYVDPIDGGLPQSAATPSNIWPAWSGTGLRSIDDGLDVLSMPLPKLPRPITTLLPPFVVRSMAERVGCWAPLVLCSWPASRWLGSRLDASGKVYLAFDDNAAFGNMSPEAVEAQKRQERLALDESEVALGVSPSLVERFREVHDRVYLQENGVETDDFSPAVRSAAVPHAVAAELEAKQSRRRGTIGFLGQIDERLDQPLIQRLATEQPDVAIVLAGPVKAGTDLSSLLALPNVFTTGKVPYAELPGLYKVLDVGLVPYVQSDLTRACNPLKAYEYLAADLPVVATALPGLNSVRDAAFVCESHDDFIAAVDRALAAPEAQVEERRRVAADASWQRRTDELERRLREATACARERRIRDGLPEPRNWRPGRRSRHVQPRLDPKDRSVRLVSGNYEQLDLSAQQKLLYRTTRMVGRLSYVGRRLGGLVRGRRDPVRRILVVRNGHLGDTVVFGPTLRALRSAFPGARIVVAVGTSGSAKVLLESMPGVDEVIELGFFNQGRLRRYAGVWALLKRGFDLTVGGAWYFNLPEAVFSGAPIRIGLYDGHPLQKYVDRLVVLDPTLHEADNNLNLVESITGRIIGDDRVPGLALNERALAAETDAFRQAVGLTVDDDVIALHPGSKRPSRRWPAKHFAVLASTLLRERPGLKVALTGAGPGERDLIDKVLATVGEDVRGRVIDAFEAGSLSGLIGFYDGCQCLVSNDTGVMHVARARGVPLVAVVGPENDRRWGPYPSGRSPAVIVRNDTPGTPHNRDEDRWLLSLRSIPAGRVASHVRRLLHEGREGDGQVVRDVERLGYDELLAAGVDVPKVAWVTTTDAAFLGCPGGKAGTVTTAWDRARQQRYPKLDVVLVARPDELGSISTDAKIVEAELPVGTAAAAWQTWSTILATTDADAFVLVGPGDQHQPDFVGRLMSTMLRGPYDEVVDVDEPLPTAVVLDGWRRQGIGLPWLFSRGMLERLLAQPLPGKPAVPPERVSALKSPVSDGRFRQDRASVASVQPV